MRGRSIWYALIALIALVVFATTWFVLPGGESSGPADNQTSPAPDIGTGGQGAPAPVPLPETPPPPSAPDLPRHSTHPPAIPVPPIRPGTAGTIGRIEPSGGSAPPTEQPTGAEPTPFPIDQTLSTLPQGAVAFTAPAELRKGDSGRVDAIIAVGATEEALRSVLPSRGQVGTDQLPVAPIMEAQLSGDLFDVSPPGPQQQAISAREPTKWSWIITAKSSGTATLRLEFSVVVQIGGAGQRRIIEVLERPILVKVTARDRIDQVFDYLEKAQFLWASILLPIGLYFYARWRKQRRADNAADQPPKPR